MFRRGFIKLREDCKTSEGHWRGQRKLGRAGKGQKKVGGEILGGAVREDSLGLCLMCFEVKNDCQKLSL